MVGHSSVVVRETEREPIRRGHLKIDRVLEARPEELPTSTQASASGSISKILAMSGSLGR